MIVSESPNLAQLIPAAILILMVIFIALVSLRRQKWQKLKKARFDNQFSEVSTETKSDDVTNLFEFSPPKTERYMQFLSKFIPLLCIAIGLLGTGLILMEYFMVGSSVLLMTLAAAVVGVSWTLKRKRELAKLEKQFPEAVDMMVRGASVGLPLLEILNQIHRELPEPVSSVFGNVSKNLGIGFSFDESFARHDFANQLKQYRYLAAILSLQSRTGGQISELLRSFSENYRESLEQHKKLQALTAEGRTSGIVVACLSLISIGILVIVNPDQLTFLLTDPEGQNLLIYCFTSTALGFLLIYRLMRMLDE